MLLTSITPGPLILQPDGSDNWTMFLWALKQMASSMKDSLLTTMLIRKGLSMEISRPETARDNSSTKPLQVQATCLSIQCNLGPIPINGSNHWLIPIRQSTDAQLTKTKLTAFLEQEKGNYTGFLKMKGQR